MRSLSRVAFIFAVGGGLFACHASKDETPGETHAAMAMSAIPARPVPPVTTNFTVLPPCAWFAKGPRPTFAEMWSAGALALDAKCTAGDAAACRTLGIASMEGAGLPRDPVRGDMLLRWAAAHGDHDAAIELLPNASVSYAIEATRGPCEKGEPLACVVFADAVRNLHNYARPTDPAAAEAALKKACDAGTLEACKAIADQLSGQDRDFHFQQLTDAAAKRCKANDARACKLLGDLSYCPGGCPDQDNARTKSANAYQGACDAGDFSSCLRAARMRSLGNQDAVAEALVKKTAAACVEGNLDACVAFTRETWRAEDPAARDVMPVLCNADVGLACVNLIRRGDAVDVPATLRSCFLMGHGCEGAASSIFDGGVYLDDPRVLTLEAMACAGPEVEQSDCQRIKDRPEIAACQLDMLEGWCNGAAIGLLGLDAKGTPCASFAKRLEEAGGDGAAEKASLVWKRACDVSMIDAQQTEACKKTAANFDNGVGVAKDPVRALEYWTIACEEYDDDACNVVSDRVGKKIGPFRAKEGHRRR